MKRGDKVKIISGQRGRPKIRYVRQINRHGGVLLEDTWYHISQLELLYGSN